MRSFIAIEIVPEGIEEIYGELRGTGADLKLVKPENLHLTMKFLGEIEEGRVEEIYTAMEKSSEGIEAFNTVLKGMGAFPSLNYIRVIWVGLEEGREPIIEMQKRLEGNLVNLGFKRDKRFEPHLTIARLRSARNKEKLAQVLSRFKDTSFGEFRVESVKLKKSVLTPKGPIYTTLREVVL